MKQFFYEAVNQQGERLNGSIYARNREEAILMLGRFFEVKQILSLEEKKPVFPFAEWSPLGFPVQELASFTRKFAQLIHSGFSPHQAIQVLANTTAHPLLRRALASIQKNLSEQGKTLAEALRPYRRIFPPLYIGIVAAGEESGNLEKVLFDLADFYEKEYEWRRKLTSRLYYPAFIFVIMYITLNILNRLLFQFTALQRVMEFILIGVIAYFILSRTRYSHPFIHALGLIVPGVGKLYRSLSLTRYFRILSLQMEAGMPILDALERSAECSADWRIQRAGRKMVEMVQKGQTLEEAFRSSGFFSPQEVGMVAVGEIAGSPGEMLKKLSTYHQLEAETTAHILVTLIPQIIYLVILILGAIVVISFWTQYFTKILEISGEFGQ
ncbi:MAG: type II secretion system F family protein [bacterium JZ-2024 1]